MLLGGHKAQHSVGTDERGYLALNERVQSPQPVHNFLHTQLSTFPLLPGRPPAAVVVGNVSRSDDEEWGM